MTAEQILDQIRKNPDHPPTISTAEWTAVVRYVTILDQDRALFLAAMNAANHTVQKQQAEIQRLQTVIAQLLDEKKEQRPPFRPMGEWLENWEASRKRRGLPVE